jgi:hypothetical protein
VIEIRVIGFGRALSKHRRLPTALRGVYPSTRLPEPFRPHF